MELKRLEHELTVCKVNSAKDVLAAEGYTVI